MDKITLASKLSLKNSFSFPLQNRLAIHEVFWGTALLILLPGVGWLLNMGHRIQFDLLRGWLFDHQRLVLAGRRLQLCHGFQPAV